MNRVAETVAALVVLALAPPLFSQWVQLPRTGSPQQTLPDRTTIAGQSGVGPFITADFVDKDANAKERRAIIDVHVDGVQIVDPASSNYEPSLAQAHIQYQVDGREIISTTSLRLEIENLSPGDHQVRIALVGNDNHPMGHQTTLKVHIPESG